MNETHDITKESLYVDNGASKGMNLVYTFFKILIVIQVFLGLLLVFVGIVNDSMLFGFWFGFEIMLSALISLLCLQFIKSRIKITQASEYYIAQMEKIYKIYTNH